MRRIHIRGEKNTGEKESGRNKPLHHKKGGAFSRKSPPFGVWLPSADGSGHWEEEISH